MQKLLLVTVLVASFAQITLAKQQPKQQLRCLEGLAVGSAIGYSGSGKKRIVTEYLCVGSAKHPHHQPVCARSFKVEKIDAGSYLCVRK